MGLQLVYGFVWYNMCTSDSTQVTDLVSLFLVSQIKQHFSNLSEGLYTLLTANDLSWPSVECTKKAFDKFFENYTKVVSFWDVKPLSINPIDLYLISTSNYPVSQHKYHIIFNKSYSKASYATTPNLGSITASSNRCKLQHLSLNHMSCSTEPLLKSPSCSNRNTTLCSNKDRNITPVIHESYPITGVTVS